MRKSDILLLEKKKNQISLDPQKSHKFEVDYYSIQKTEQELPAAAAQQLDELKMIKYIRVIIMEKMSNFFPCFAFLT